MPEKIVVMHDADVYRDIRKLYSSNKKLAAAVCMLGLMTGALFRRVRMLSEIREVTSEEDNEGSN